MDPRPEMTKICRTCLTEGAPMRSIYSVEEALGEESTTLCNILTSCSSIRVLPGDGLPENVCTNCAAEMIRAYLFWKLCEKSNATLQHFLDSLRDLQVKQEEGIFVYRLEEWGDESESEITEEKPCLEQLVVIKEEYRGSEDDLPDGRNVMTVKPITRLKSEGATVVRRVKIPHKNGIVKKRNLPKTCDICNKTFRSHSKLQQHVITHTGEKPHRCDVCGKGFAQLSYLRIHANIHTGEKPYKCQHCEKSFTAPSALKIHVRFHSGQRPYVCNLCGKAFLQPGYLSSHMKLHTGERRFECKICHKKFSHSMHLRVHMRIHSGEKPYACSECSRCFTTKNILTRHIRTHTGERPYVCATCGQSFAQSSTLATHKKTHKPK